jgi:hypothetical protein
MGEGLDLSRLDEHQQTHYNCFVLWNGSRPQPVLRRDVIVTGLCLLTNVVRSAKPLAVVPRRFRQTRPDFYSPAALTRNVELYPDALIKLVSGELYRHSPF